MNEEVGKAFIRLRSQGYDFEADVLFDAYRVKRERAETAEATLKASNRQLLELQDHAKKCEATIRAQAEQIKNDQSVWAQDVKEIILLKAERDALVAALVPFSVAHENHTQGSVTLHDFRAAHEAISTICQATPPSRLDPNSPLVADIVRANGGKIEATPPAKEPCAECEDSGRVPPPSRRCRTTHAGSSTCPGCRPDPCPKCQPKPLGTEHKQPCETCAGGNGYKGHAEGCPDQPPREEDEGTEHGEGA